MAKKNRTYIYRLYWPNGESKKSYIGQSQEKYTRYTAHRYLLSIGKHTNKAMQEAYNSINTFPEFEILEYVEDAWFATTREQYYLQLYWPNCFNKLIPGYMHGFDFKGHFEPRIMPPLRPDDKRLKANRATKPPNPSF